MTIQRLDHLVFAVEDIEETAKAWEETLGIRAAETVRPEGTEIEISFLPAGDSILELVCPTSQESPIARAMAERGPGMLSISLEVDDIEAAVQDLRSKGVEASGPDKGILPDTRIARIPREAAHGVAVQLIERQGK